ncbi:MAG: DnaJ domain-containing protein [Acidobacteriota bacterium]
MVVVVLSTHQGWIDFEMQFFSGENLIENRTKMDLNVAEMLVVSARRAVSKKLVTLPERFLRSTIVSNSSLFVQGMKIPLNEAESYAYTRAHDSILVSELLPLMPSVNMPSQEALQSLYTLGLIDMQSPSGGASIHSGASTVSESFLTSIGDMLVRFEKTGLYEILSVDKSASFERIQTAYHELAKQYHPDRFQSEGFPESLQGQVAQVFSYINKAYSTLRDPVLRAAYDEENRKKENSSQSPSQVKSSSDTTEDDAVEALFRLGRRSMIQGNFEKAIRELKSCIYLRPDNAQYNHFLGLAESEVRGLYKNAEQHFMKAIELESMSMDSRIALVKLYLKVNLRRKASLALEEVVRWDPGNPEIKKLSDQIKKIDSRTKES